jgi:hypothetical protein
MMIKYRYKIKQYLEEIISYLERMMSSCVRWLTLDARPIPGTSAMHSGLLVSTERLPELDRIDCTSVWLRTECCSEPSGPGTLCCGCLLVCPWLTLLCDRWLWTDRALVGRDCEFLTPAVDCVQFATLTPVGGTRLNVLLDDWPTAVVTGSVLWPFTSPAAGCMRLRPVEKCVCSKQRTHSRC